jgi:glycosyltransferase involved in cell wall biosynthesis
MLFNCIPIVSDKYALPEVVGNAGFCINPQSDEEAVEVIAKVLKGELHPKENPRDRILREFPIERRAEKLLSIMNDLLGK